MVKIAIVGFGIVGGGVAEILQRNAKIIEKNAGEAIEVKYIVDLRDMPESPFAHLMVKDFAVVESDPEVKIVVEAIGGCGAALTFVRRALAAGKSVVTSNKQLVAEHGLELFALAKATGANFLFEASVGGGIPVLNPLTRCLGANELYEVSGILNGTTNYILSQMLEKGESFDGALKRAQQLGYAEANPAADVEGTDAARKSCILAGLAFGENVSPDEIYVEGITKVTSLDASFAEAGGMKIKLLGRALRQNGKKFVFVSPHFMANTLPLAAVGDVFNAVLVRGSDVGETMFYGPGAGRYPTASAVIGDIIDIVKNPGRAQPTGWETATGKVAPFSEFTARFYLRTREEKAAVEEKLGQIDWIPARSGENGGITAPMTRAALDASGVALDACLPVFE